MQDIEVKIPWNVTETWNDVCIWAIDQFGLPGNKFEWHAHKDYMQFLFKDEVDAIYFILRWS